ncbi:helix-turn-helix domain-containing protein [Nocardia altamirensis]|uniref:helix-turn-helix domain-containing protein n=1 Tax=Nocardia altamirensis TaxID=472158 RepID=UPI0008402F92|nr:helix-turn-helix domain-containing protein [Nocardia altamirensis]
MEHLDHVVAERVRRAMSDAGLCPEDLAARSGLPASDLRSLLAAHGSFTVDELNRIAAAVHCRIVDLLPDDGDLL